MTVAALSYSDEQLAQTQKGLIRTCVSAVEKLADDIFSYELSAEDLPEFSAGSHIDVHLPGGIIRQYSLCNDPQESHRYVIAVLRESNGRGGSEYIHEHVVEGDELLISQPRNHFPLIIGKGPLHFVAGGIGITPIMAMVAECVRKNVDFHLHYCVRSRSRAAFLEPLRPLLDSGKATVYVDDEGIKPNFQNTFAQPGAGEHIYYCGPSGFMDHLALVTKHWPKDTVHFERFSAGTDQEALQDDSLNEAFEVRLASSGKTYTVQADESIPEVLRRNGVQVDVSCEEGYCGTCMTRYVGGQPEHRDSVLDDANRRSYVMICCARAKEGPLILDI
ncbi:PDR/VanB family oxidoreductase [Eoetvoesiella caeni]|uniref:Vanillate O-demethylase ferredoxin subunit n=1 Tax=Eoetvoesiella caeni TaxID=645616 RepID=A0A366HHY4_9BURK|nr:PDR/VanB family oxidoreductase [Eoetvoesiella caeni]MCI2807826.1 PDR/VanB family oxidoreductase [Eoetvoesiella caeni]NYT54172.1 oxidoreductase [Eoetvoesiella caeni]RBP41741.1 vanillate O-demethylase ferredoxin subunit [Eoetvoesiella caeni]